MNRKTPSIVGAAVGLALFLAIALLPALPDGWLRGRHAGRRDSSGPRFSPPSRSVR